MQISDISGLLLNSLHMNQLQINKTALRLSTGHKLPTDNPVDIGRASRLELEIRTRSARQRAMQDEMTKMQVADNGLSQMKDIGNRLKELSEQYASGSLSDEEKKLIESEAKALGGQIISIMKKSSYNGTSVFEDGSLKIGSSEDSILISLPSLSKIDPTNKGEQATTAELKSSVELSNSITSPATLTLPSIPLTMEKIQTPTVQEVSVQTTSVQIESADCGCSSETSAVPYYKIPAPTVSVLDEHGQNGYVQLYDKNGQLQYEGNLTNGKADGFGRLYNNGKLVYEGDFKNGVYDGFGAAYDENGVLRYRGDIKGGVADGWGTFYNGNGTTLYAGGIQSGYREGWGTTFDESGNYIEARQYDDFNLANVTTSPSNNCAPSDNTGISSNDDGKVDDNKGAGNSGKVGDTGDVGKPNEDTGKTDDTNDSSLGTGNADNPGNTVGGGDTNHTGNTGGAGNDDEPKNDGQDDNHTLSFADLATIDAKDLLDPDNIKNMMEQITGSLGQLSIQESITDRQIGFEANMQSIDEDQLGRIQSVDTAKEMVEKVRQDLLQNVTTTILTDILDQRRTYISTLLQSF